VSSVGFSLRAFLAFQGESMPRHKIFFVVAVVALAALTVNATDFWLTKDWHQWTKDECATILNDSPWTRTQETYTAQLRSSLPVREAIVRQLEIAQQYDQKTDAQQKAFDDAAGTILRANYDKTILVRLYFSKDAPGPQIMKNLQPTIVTEDGQQITPTQTDADPMTPNAVDFYFPRLINGAPAIKPTQKQFSFQFQIPQLQATQESFIRPQRITINFDLTKMLVGGRPNY
jgi:hypothetical protein